MVTVPLRAFPIRRAGACITKLSARQARALVSVPAAEGVGGRLGGAAGVTAGAGVLGLKAARRR